VWPALQHAVEPLLVDRRVHRVQLDTYVRETRRYGGERAILACEEIFFHDSRAVVAFLAQVTGDAGLDARWRFAFVGIDRLLDDLGLDLAAKLTLAKTLAKGYATEFRMDAKLSERMRDRFRTERAALDALLESGGDGAALLGERSQRIREACRDIRALARSGELASPIADVAASLLHMHANRVLRSSNRAQEMVLYHYLEKTYASRLARARTPEEVDA